MILEGSRPKLKTVQLRTGSASSASVGIPTVSAITVLLSARLSLTHRTWLRWKPFHDVTWTTSEMCVLCRRMIWAEREIQLQF